MCLCLLIIVVSASQVFDFVLVLQTALNLYYLAIIGHGLSIASLLISLGIFFYFK